MNRYRVLLAFLVTLSLAAAQITAVGAQDGITQLAMVLDGSGSISPGDWQIMRNGLADAVETCLPDTGIVELTVIQFSSTVVTHVPPTVITSANKASVATSIRGMAQLGALTIMDLGFDEAVAQVTGSPNFATAKKQVINISTDGIPQSTTNAEAARDRAISAGFDEIDAEAVGFGPDLAWLRDGIVYPQPGEIYGGTYPPLPDNPDPGWVFYVADFQEYADTVCKKIEEIVPPEPEECCIDKNCPDDPELSKNCDPVAPPFYVVINREFEDLSRPGTGCQPIILKYPKCVDCCNEKDPACRDANKDLETRVCPLLASKVDWSQSQGTEIVYQMCCGSATDCDGKWYFRMRLLHPNGTCPIDPQNPGCYDCLPPGTGIDLPAPLIVSGLAIIGIGLLAAGLLVRRRLLRVA